MVRQAYHRNIHFHKWKICDHFLSVYIDFPINSCQYLFNKCIKLKIAYK